jgi:hypothetical protein
MINRSNVIATIIFMVYVLMVNASPLKMTNQKTSRSDSVALENDYVTVMHNMSVFGNDTGGNIATRIIVALTGVNISKGKDTIHLERGAIAAFHAGESYSQPSGEYFEVAFKKNHPPLKVPEQWIEPAKNIIVYEDTLIRVFKERLDGGDVRPLHSHAQRVVVRLNEVQLTDPRFHETPRAGSGIQVPNTVKFAEPVVHVVKNMSKGPLFNIVLEFKLHQ